MTHRAACNETGNRLGPAHSCLIHQKPLSLIFDRAADFTNHDDRLDVVICLEQFQHVDEFSSLDRGTANADGLDLAQPRNGGLKIVRVHNANCNEEENAIHASALFEGY